AVAVGVGVGVADAITTTVPTICGCASQTNEYVPGALNVHVPAQPFGSVNAGSGGTGPRTGPAVCVHDVGSPSVKSTLCALLPDGSENDAVPPAAIVTVVSPVLGSWNPKSYAWMLAVIGGAGSPCATAGTPTPAMPAQTSHGKYFFLRPTQPSR